MNEYLEELIKESYKNNTLGEVLGRLLGESYLKIMKEQFTTNKESEEINNEK